MKITPPPPKKVYFVSPVGGQMAPLYYDKS